MEPRLSIITLGVADLGRSLRFYRDGLGFPTTWTEDRGVIFFKTTYACLALYPFEKLAEDAGPEFAGPRSKFAGITLAHNVRTRDEVSQVLQLAESAGGRIIKPAQDAFWGGHHGYFADPDDYLWEIAFGAFDLNPDGSLAIP